MNPGPKFHNQTVKKKPQTPDTNSFIRDRVRQGVSGSFPWQARDSDLEMAHLDVTAEGSRAKLELLLNHQNYAVAVSFNSLVSIYSMKWFCT